MSDLTNQLQFLKENVQKLTVEKKDQVLRQASSAFDTLKREFNNLSEEQRKTIKDAYNNTHQSIEEFKTAHQEKLAEINTKMVKQLHDLNEKITQLRKK